MPENPLLPHARLRELYARLQRAHALAPRGRARHEAVFAATTLLLEERDLLLPMPGEPVAAALQIPAAKKGRATKKEVAPSAATPEDAAGIYLSLATGAALAQSRAGNGGLVLTYATAGLRSGWAEPLAFAHQQRLPLVLACFESNARSRAGSLSEAALAQLPRKFRLPVLRVDAADAVAVYRCMQESVVRVRQGGGPAILWCVTPESAALSNPVRRMEKYLATRGLLPRSVRAASQRQPAQK